MSAWEDSWHLSYRHVLSVHLGQQWSKDSDLSGIILNQTLDQEHCLKKWHGSTTPHIQHFLNWWGGMLGEPRHTPSFKWPTVVKLHGQPDSSVLDKQWCLTTWKLIACDPRDKKMRYKIVAKNRRSIFFIESYKAVETEDGFGELQSRSSR